MTANGCAEFVLSLFDESICRRQNGPSLLSLHRQTNSRTYDMETDSKQTERPKKVQNAATILYITLGIGIVRAVMDASANAELTGVGLLMCITLVVFAVVVFLIAMIVRGRNWARIAFLILFLLGLIPAIGSLIVVFMRNPISGILGFLQIVLQVVALIFLFQSDSSEWFRAKPQLHEPS
jgi:membrane-bound ClpP family serine protease